MEEQRPSPDALLKQIETDPARLPGRLKIFFGYAAGVGKTYAMLDAAHQMKRDGADVVAGYIEPHTRPETLHLLDGLEQLPPRLTGYQGIQLREFDLDGALARHPQLILVDELAHTNAPGSRHRKRYQDIEELLRAGIDVYTTVNVQHLESLNDLVSSITGVVVSERVPDGIFDAAAQVEVVDLEPDELMQRLQQGKIYREEQAQQALHHFFTRKNLDALRELALRRTADRLGRTAEKSGERAVADAGEHILICLSSAPSNAKVIRTAARMAEAFHSGFTALFVQTPRTSELKGDNLRRLRQNLKLAEDLGARVATVYGDDIAAQIAEYARISGVSKIVVGRTNNKRRFFAGKNLIDRLTEYAPHMEVYVIPDSQPRFAPAPRGKAPVFRFSPLELGKCFAAIALSTLIGGVFYAAGFREANIITVYILGVLFSSVWARGRAYGAIASLLSVVVFNFFFTEPRFTLHAYDASYPMTFLVMLIASFITSTLAGRVKTQAEQAAQKAYRTEVLLQTSQKLQKAEGADAILLETARQMVKLLGRTVLFYPVGADDGLGQAQVYFPGEPEPAEAYLTEEERAVAEWVRRNNKHAGATTGTLPGSRCLYLAVRGTARVFAVAGVAMDRQPDLDSFERNLLIAMLGECGLALEKDALGKEKQAAEMQMQQETLRANLLRAISHDLRTPLTSISGSAGILMASADRLTPEKRSQLYTDIYDDAMWLVDLVENLLSVTRIENGTMDIHVEPELVDEVFREALGHLDRHAADHVITCALADDLLLARMDARLIVQVVINLVNNAIKYTPVGSHITLSAEKQGGMVSVRVADDGPGVPDEAKPRLFDMFYTAAGGKGDSRRGLGLGLALCRSIVQAHGGEITVTDNTPRGAAFSFTLEQAEVS